MIQRLLLRGRGKSVVAIKTSTELILIVNKCMRLYIKVIIIMPPTLKKLMGHIAFGACVGACVGGCMGHTFCTYCNF